jgi:hypothetical protein
MSDAQEFAFSAPATLHPSDIVDRKGRLHVSWDLQWRPLSQLFVDYHDDFLNGEGAHGGAMLSYQRKQETTGRVMASMGKKGYKPDLFGVLIGTEREDGTIALGDGGTRYRFLTGLVERGELAPDVLVPVLVNEWEPQREISNYIDLNRERASLSQVDWFVAKVKLGDKDAVDLNRILIEESGMGVGHKKGGWQAVSTLQQAFNRGNLRQTVIVLRRLGWLELPRGRSQGMIGAVSRIFTKPGADMDRMLVAWDDWTPNMIHQSARDYLQTGQSRAMAIAIAMHLGKLYNKGLRGKRKIDLGDMISKTEDEDEQDAKEE